MPAFVRRVVLRNYKSIAACDVTLEPLTVLVGPNGSGKSNFLDALGFVADALNLSVEHALRDRGGVNNVRRRSRGHPHHFGIRLDVVFADGRTALYAFTIGAEAHGGFLVQREECRVYSAGALSDPSYFFVKEGNVVDASCTVRSVIEKDRLALGALSAIPDFRPLYESLCGMCCYNLSPQRIRELQDPDRGQLLARDGHNIASVLRVMASTKRSDALERIDAKLKEIVPGIAAVAPIGLGPKETLQFEQLTADDDAPWSFYPESMSDGTLRALGILVALFQGNASGGRAIRLVGIEEPEIAIHPGAVDVLAGTIAEASAETQIVVTTHSPDLLDHETISDEQIRAVRMVDGLTRIGPVDTATRKTLEAGLRSVGTLLREDRLEPDQTAEADQKPLFEPPDEAAPD